MPYEEHFCKIILNLGQQIRRFRLKFFFVLYFSAGGNFVRQFGTVLGNLSRGLYEEHSY